MLCVIRMWPHSHILKQIKFKLSVYMLDRKLIKYQFFQSVIPSFFFLLLKIGCLFFPFLHSAFIPTVQNVWEFYISITNIICLLTEIPLQ